jgi:hypothetical protein
MLKIPKNHFLLGFEKKTCDRSLKPFVSGHSEEKVRNIDYISLIERYIKL